MDRFQNKYRIALSRLATWNYGTSGWYFITICTKNRKCYFGNVENDKMVLNGLGLAVFSEWKRTPELRPDMNLQLGDFVVIPNHFHILINIGENDFNAIPNRLHSDNSTGNKFGPQSKNLASIIRGFKASITAYAKKKGILFDWQTRFYGHIVRDMKELMRIADYIINNPVNRKEDKFFGL